MMYEKLRQALSVRHKRKITMAGCKPSAVLVPLFIKEGQEHILFTKRTQHLKYHKGQISFPGGALEKGETLFETAVRESTEEIGLAPADVELLGELDDVITWASNYIISPFVVAFPYPYQYKVNRREIEELIEVPITALQAKGCMRQETEVQGTESVINYLYHCQDRIIWGATARITHQLLDILEGIEKQGTE
jgi:8-oxo-dGTP pyrophosphatase MutT (NUDIX family)